VALLPIHGPGRPLSVGCESEPGAGEDCRKSSIAQATVDVLRTLAMLSEQGARAIVSMQSRGRAAALKGVDSPASGGGTPRGGCRGVASHRRNRRMILMSPRGTRTRVAVVAVGVLVSAAPLDGVGGVRLKMTFSIRRETRPR